MEPLHDDAYAAAADWHTRLDEDDSAQTYAEFDAWLAADPRNKPAFDAVERTWSSLSTARVDARVLKLRREAVRRQSIVQIRPCRALCDDHGVSD